MPYQPYTSITLAQSKIDLAERLDDPTMTFWGNSELGVYLVESLRAYQAFSAIWRQRVQVPLPYPSNAAGQNFYDLNDIATDLCWRSTTDQEAIDRLCYALIEPLVDWTVTPAVWAGTSQFTLGDLTSALERRRNQFLLETGCIVTHSTVAVPAAPIGRVLLPTSVIEPRRLAWIPVQGPAIPLWKEDESALNGFMPGWSVDTGTPAVVSVLAPPPLQVQLGPIPADAGTLDLLSLNLGPDLDPANGATILGVPNDCTWIVVFGALADLLSGDGPSKDLSRAAYCEGRWKDGLTLTRLMSTVLQASINGIPQPSLPAVWDLDGFLPDWQGPTGTPSTVAMAGWNLVAIAPAPDANGPYSLTMDIVQNMPVPGADADYLQIGQELYDVVLEYAQHLAMFKCGGAEFLATQTAYQRLIDMARLQNERIVADTLFPGAIGDQTRKEARFRPFRKDPQPLPVALVGPEG